MAAKYVYSKEQFDEIDPSRLSEQGIKFNDIPVNLESKLGAVSAGRTKHRSTTELISWRFQSGRSKALGDPLSTASDLPI
ncbi:hypothetical protein KQX54_017219 [Cotesia glomerata]|uniref:Uncharacterized protein n=1 Tax=Cotesia glomerata TaxID=32391 RepID=A0AAV7J041_COTGL|nr:hypothetical protein KQX54_017219 [Cotesia glomerata]